MLKSLLYTMLPTCKIYLDEDDADEDDEVEAQVEQASALLVFLTIEYVGARKGMLDNTDWAMAQDRAFFTAAAIKIQLASRAKKAKRAVEARRKRIEETKEETVREEAAGGEHQEAKANMNEQVDGILASPRL